MHRRRLDRRPYTFLKISDGCDHACSFCSIPLMKGKHRSVTRDILIEEMRALVADGVKEFNLVAQDLADYGKDLDDGYRLPRLLRDLCAVDGDFWIRCLYLYPGGVTDEFLEVVATEPKIVPYVDMPLQHLDPDTMHLMKRPYREKNTLHLVKRMRAAVPGLTFRTTMIVGFPGETEDAHQRMLDGLRALRFNWVGAFRYSREEDTPAGQARNQIPDEVKEERWHAIMELQSTITAEYNRARIGTSARVLVENFDETSNRWTGRSPSEAPEVDGSVLFSSDAPVAAGHFANVFITAADVYDVMGRAT
jgi:ribosomal protein S12 methylthiotransferase